MKTQVLNLIKALAMIVLLLIGVMYKFGRRWYRRFCIKVLWKKLQIRTSVYEQWHAKRAAKLQTALNIEHSEYPSF